MDDIKPPKKAAPKPAHAKVAPNPAEVEPPIKNLDEPIVINEADLDKKPAKPKRTGRFDFIKHWKTRWWDEQGRRGKAIVITTLVLIIGLLGTGLYLAFGQHQKIPNAQTAKKNPVKASLTVASPLSGVQINPLLAKRPVTAIMIENSLDARPQSGLQDAGVVYEAIAEGGITRFAVLFQDTSPQYIGPVRSLRPYYIDWATAFDASIVHVGGSPEALAQIRSGGKDLDQFFNAGSFWRQTTRPAPHDLYTSFNLLDRLNESKGYTSSQFTSWLRKKDKKLAVPTAKTIDFAVSSANFNVHYDYDPLTNSYARSQGGKPHVATASEADTTGVQLKPKVVVGLITGYAIDSDGVHSAYTVNGSGQALIFQDGGLTVGTWTKADRASQIKFTDGAGKPVKLNAGQTWVTVLGDSSLATYAP